MNILDQIAATMKRLNELKEVVTCNAVAFAHWHFASTADSSLVQLFPDSDETPIEEKQAQARVIAKLFGGEWRRDRSDGSWQNEGSTWRVVLHRVESNRRDECKVDLSDPEPAEADRDEPDYDAPKPLTPLENMLQNDEHHVR